MCGFQTTSKVRDRASANPLSYSRLTKGRPILPLDLLTLPDRAGVKLGVVDWLKLIIKVLPRVPAFYASRPAVIDARLSKVLTPLDRPLWLWLIIILSVHRCDQGREDVRENWGGGVCSVLPRIAVLFMYWAVIASEGRQPFV